MKSRAQSRAARVAAAAALLLVAAGGRAGAGQVHLEVSVAQPVMLADLPGNNFIKIGLTGAVAPAGQRPPVNVALVLDRSGSMAGEKLARAKEAVIGALARLGPRDAVSVLAYDESVAVLVPATRVIDHRALAAAVGRIAPGGSSALFAGVSHGAAEVRKFLAPDRVNRVVLLSDGEANLGPRSPGALGHLGASLLKEGISVTTIGLDMGNNEDLMAKLAQGSDGNLAFARRPGDLIDLFQDEFDDLFAVVAQEVVVRVNCAPGIRPVRGVGRDLEVVGDTAYTRLNQLYGGTEKYLLLEVEIPAGRDGSARSIATVEVRYVNLTTGTPERLGSTVAVRYSSSATIVGDNSDREANVAVYLQQATERNRRAVQLRDSGQTAEAQRLLVDNAKELSWNGIQFNSQTLLDYAVANDTDAQNLDGSAWAAQRRRMRANQFANTANVGRGNFYGLTEGSLAVQVVPLQLASEGFAAGAENAADPAGADSEPPLASVLNSAVEALEGGGDSARLLDQIGEFCPGPLDPDAPLIGLAWGPAPLLSTRRPVAGAGQGEGSVEVQVGPDEQGGPGLPPVQGPLTLAEIEGLAAGSNILPWVDPAPAPAGTGGGVSGARLQEPPSPPVRARAAPGATGF